MIPIFKIEDFGMLTIKDGAIYSPDFYVRQAIVDICNALVEKRTMAITAQTPDEGVTWNCSTEAQEGDTHVSRMLPPEVSE